MRSLLACSALFPLFLSGCLTLEPLAPGACGNGVIDATEDCDTFPDKADTAGHRCIEPTALAGACRFACGGTGSAKLTCPGGYGCGGDGICRRASGGFDKAVDTSERPVQALYSGDFDGDGHRDVLVSSDSGFEVIYIGATGAFEQTTDLPVGLYLRPSVGDLTGDEIDDIVANVGGGIGVYRGRGDRTFAPTTYSSIVMPVIDARILGADALPSVPGQEPLALGTPPNFPFPQTLLFWVDPTNLVGNDATPLQLMDGPNDKLADDIPHAQLDEDLATSPCEEIVTPFKEKASVLIARTCRYDAVAQTFVLNTQYQDFTAPVPMKDPAFLPAIEVMLAGGATVGDGVGVRIHDINGDGHLDLVIGVTGAADPVQVAYGVGNGSFHSDPAAIPSPPATGDNMAAPYPAFVSYPLAIGDLDDDGVPDYVDASGIYVSGLSITTAPCPLSQALAAAPYQAAVCSDTYWIEARIADLNANGVLDVIAADGARRQLDFYNGAGAGAFNRFPVKTDGFAHRLTVGDFDGDLILDVAVAQSTEPITDVMTGVPEGDEPGAGDTQDAFDDLAVLFGKSSGAPEPPASMGRLPRIAQMVEAHFTNAIGEAPDGISELGILSKLKDAKGKPLLTVALLSGSSDRHLQSPFVLLRQQMSPKTGIRSDPLVTVVGELAKSESPHADICALASEVDDLGATKYHLWLASSSGEALLDPTHAKQSAQPVPDSELLGGVYAPLLATVDLDKDGVDEVVMFYTAFTVQGTEGRMFVYRTSKDDTLVGDAAQTAPYWFGSQSAVGTFFGGLGDSGATRVVVSDVDADGFPDVVVMAEAASLDAYSIDVIVVWNDHGQLDLSKRTTITLPPDAFAAAFEVMEADGDPGREIAIATAGGVYLVDVAKRKAGALVPIADLPGGNALLAHDFTGDGIDDLLIGDYAGLRLHPGVARNK